MIFQDSMTSLNPVLTIGRQLEETISVHSSLSKDEIKAGPGYPYKGWCLFS